MEVSRWEDNPENLKQFLNLIVAKGGGDYPEALEIGLSEVLIEKKTSNISQSLAHWRCARKKS